MPHLDQRLRAVARQIHWRTHADIGSDHGHLLKALLKAGRIERAIAIENKVSPWENSRRTLSGLSADVRLADGLAGLSQAEADGLSISGMGGAAITRILDAFPDRVPPTIVLQPNCKADHIRRWAISHRYNLVDEILVPGPIKRGKLGLRRRFVVMRFEKSAAEWTTAGAFDDEAYAGLDREAALLFGPRLMRAFDREFADSLTEERAYLKSLPCVTNKTAQRLAAIERIGSKG